MQTKLMLGVAVLAALLTVPSAAAVGYYVGNNAVQMNVAPGEMENVYRNSCYYATLAKLNAAWSGRDTSRSVESIAAEIRAHYWGNRWGRVDFAFGLDYGGYQRAGFDFWTAWSTCQATVPYYVNWA